MDGSETIGIAIDPPGTTEVDDAVAARELPGGGWEVVVRIPDVAAAVPRGSAADETARERGETRYHAHGRDGMLDAGVADAATLSDLRPGPIVDVRIRVSRDLTPEIADVRRGAGRITARMSYDEAGRVLDDPAHALHGEVSTMWRLARLLGDERTARAGATFDESGRTWFDEEGRLTTSDGRSDTRGNVLVMEMMVLANAALAAYAFERRAPVIYRNHVMDGFTRGDRASAAREMALREGVGVSVARRRMAAMSHLIGPARGGTAPAGHHGLDLRAYAWFTSPLRRYADLHNARALLEGVEDGNREDLARHLDEVRRSRREESGESYGRSHRARLARDVLRGRHVEADKADVHTIMRALAEADRIDADAAMRHLDRRMRRDDMTGRDIDALRVGGRDLLGPNHAARIEAWVSSSPARVMLAREANDGATRTRAQASENHKGRLFEIASRRRARVTFSEATRSGPPHAPAFTVNVTWDARDATFGASGIGTTIRTAEQAAAREMLDMMSTAPDAPNATTDAKPRAATSAAPKTRLLEQGILRGMEVGFGEPRKEGPDHQPRFEVDAWIGRTRATGVGSNKRDAERDASSKLLEAVERL